MPIAPEPQRRFALALFLLMLSSIAISYIDRGALAIAAPSMREALSLSPIQFGWLLSAFFWTYALCQPAAGWLLDRYGIFVPFGLCFLIWSLATLGISFVHSFPALLAARFLLGAGESIAYPAYSKLMIVRFPAGQRGLLNATLDAASKSGPAASMMIGAFVIEHHGWRTLFFLLGVAGIFWLLPWAVWGPRETKSHTSHHTQQSIRPLLERRELWATSAGMFCLGYGWFFLVSWLPQYLASDRHFSLAQIGAAGSLPFWSMALSAIVCGIASDALLRRGMAADTRRWFVAVGFLLSGILLALTAMIPSSSMALLCLTLSCVGLGVATSNIWAVTQTLAGERYAGLWTGIQNCIGNFGGVLSPLFTGYLVSHYGSFRIPIMLAACMFALGSVIYFTCIQSLSTAPPHHPAV